MTAHITAEAVEYLMFGARCVPGATDTICMPPMTCFADDDQFLAGVCVMGCSDAQKDEYFFDLPWILPPNTPSTMNIMCQPDGCYSLSQCDIGHVYHCSGGFYGTNQDCTKCPGEGTSYAHDNKAITRCYLAPGKTYTDDIGTFYVTNDCYYAL